MNQMTFDGGMCIVSANVTEVCCIASANDNINEVSLGSEIDFNASEGFLSALFFFYGEFLYL